LLLLPLEEELELEETESADDGPVEAAVAEGALPTALEPAVCRFSLRDLRPGADFSSKAGLRAAPAETGLPVRPTG
jgi:hypothetical protein